MHDELTAISFKLSVSLREKIQEAAKREERSESGYLRFHLGEIFKMSEAETSVDDEGTPTQPT